MFYFCPQDWHKNEIVGVVILSSFTVHQAESLSSNLFQIIVLERVNCHVMDIWVKLEDFTGDAGWYFGQLTQQVRLF